MAPSNRTSTGRFPPGVSGNPTGRVPLPPEIKARLAELGPVALRRLAELLHSQNEAIAVRAAEALLDRAYGKAIQAHEMDEELTSALTSLAAQVAQRRNGSGQV